MRDESCREKLRRNTHCSEKPGVEGSYNGKLDESCTEKLRFAISCSEELRSDRSCNEKRDESYKEKLRSHLQVKCHRSVTPTALASLSVTDL